MLKLLNFSFIFIIFLFTACADKIPFTPSKNLQNSALVYIYVPNEVTSTDNTDSTVSYKLKIGNEPIKDYISDGEYMVFHIKPSSTTFYATKDAIITRSLRLDLKKNRTYYLKISKLSDNSDFTFQQIKKDIALKEIVNTGLANSVKVDKKRVNPNIINEKPKKETKAVSKIEEIQKAYDLKEKGILTQAEFNKLKEEILSK